MRSRTSSGAPACFICSLGLIGSRSPSAHWPSLRAFAGRAVVIRGFSFANVASHERAKKPVSPGCADPGASWRYRWAGSTTSRQTATAADTLEVDVPPRHQGDTQAAIGDGHAPILPQILTS